MRLKRGDVYLVDLGVCDGSVQSGKRPALIVQNDVGNSVSPTTTICPITSKKKKQMPTHVSIDPEDCDIRQSSIILCEQITTVSREKLVRKIGEVYNSEIMKEVNRKIKLQLGLQ